VHARDARGCDGHGHRGRSLRDGAGGHSLPMAPLLWGRGQGHEGGGRGVPGKMCNDVAHRGGRWGGRERPARWHSGGGGWLVRARVIQRRHCRSVRGRVR
jgi:hypothetical protein